MKQSVQINVLCGGERGGWINPHLHARLFQSIFDANAERRPVAVEVMQGVSPVDRARNQVVQQFLATEYDWLVMVDNDIVPPEHFLKMISAAEEDAKFVIGLPYPIIKETGVTLSVAYKSDSADISGFLTNELPAGWTKIDYVGTGFIAIRRCVLETIKAPWFAFTPAMGEDFDFCSKARAAGFQIWTHGSFVCDHLHSYSLLELFRATRAPAVAEDQPLSINITFKESGG